MTADGFYNTRHGRYSHSEMIGKKWGARVRRYDEAVLTIQLPSSNGKGFLTLLHPTPEWWTIALPHRTQILYLADISLIMMYLDVRPGKIVVESGTHSVFLLIPAGTGSGSFTHSLARTVAPNGKILTFEYHEDRAEKARMDFESHKLDSIVQLECRDVCQNGFGLDDVADAVFLDLPSPWEAIAASKLALKVRITMHLRIDWL